MIDEVGRATNLAAVGECEGERPERGPDEGRTRLGCCSWALVQSVAAARAASKLITCHRHFAGGPAAQGDRNVESLEGGETWNLKGVGCSQKTLAAFLGGDSEPGDVFCG